MGIQKRYKLGNVLKDIKNFSQFKKKKNKTSHETKKIRAKVFPEHSALIGLSTNSTKK